MVDVINSSGISKLFGHFPAESETILNVKFADLILGFTGNFVGELAPEGGKLAALDLVSGEVGGVGFWFGFYFHRRL